MSLRDRSSSTGASTIFRVAQEAGVSITTVSHVFSGKRRVSDTTRERVLDVARRLDYQPRASARALATGRSMTMALQHSMSGPESMLNPFFERMLVAMSETAVQAGYSYIFVPPDPTAEIFIAPLIGERRVDGALLIDPIPGDHFVAAVVAHEIPAVSLGRVEGHPDGLKVDHDHAQACRDVLDHFAQMGYERPAMMLLPVEMSYVLDSATAFRESAPPGSPVVAVSEFSERAAHERALELLDRSPRPDAIYCLSDVLALGIARAARDRGIDIPGELGIVGVGDTGFAHSAALPLTSVRTYPERAGSLLVELLIAAVAAGDTGDAVAQPELLPSELVLRRSTARR